MNILNIQIENSGVVWTAFSADAFFSQKLVIMGLMYVFVCERKSSSLVLRRCLEEDYVGVVFSARTGRWKTEQASGENVMI